MKEEERGRLWLIVAALSLAACLLWLPALAGAATTVSDADTDGLSDAEEAAGIALPPAAPTVTFPSCGATAPLPGPTRNLCVDKGTRDLFVIFTPLGSGSLMPATFDEAMEYVWRAKSAGGLEIATHRITTAQVRTTPRNVTATQKAVKVTEASDNTSTTILGTSTYGTPNGTNNVVVYSRRIERFIDNVCTPNVTSCTDSTGQATDKAAVTAKYVRHTIAHEVGHDVSLTYTSNAAYGGYHYATGTNTVMEQSVYKEYPDSASVKFFVSDTFTSVDQGVYRMK